LFAPILGGLQNVGIGGQHGLPPAADPLVRNSLYLTEYKH
jgi:hypothetical protein